jgi:carnitine O-acetyltransferase
VGKLYAWINTGYAINHVPQIFVIISVLSHATSYLWTQALFGACRVPELSDKDIVAVNPESCHVVVLENNQFYFFRALWPDGVVAVDEDDILEILKAIKADASQVSPESSSRNALGVLTTLSRREWAIARESIVTHSTNNETMLEIIEGALFVLAIDDVAPNSISDAAANMLHGTYNHQSEDHSIEYQVSTIWQHDQKSS